MQSGKKEASRRAAPDAHPYRRAGDGAVRSYHFSDAYQRFSSNQKSKTAAAIERVLN